MKREIIHFTKAVPARKRDILLWLITSGRMGKLFIPMEVERVEWSNDNYNCRCKVKSTT